MNRKVKLGRKIRAARIARGLTQDAVCGLAKLSKGFYSDLENGKRGVSVANLLRIATALGVGIGDLAE